MEDKLIALLNSFLGEYGKHCGEWYSYNCPCCASSRGVESDNKYNLEINFNPDKLIFHCWRCGDSDNMKGRLSVLIKKYGGKQIYNEYKNIIEEYKQTQLFNLHFNNDLADDISSIKEISLPMNFKPLISYNKESQQAWDYLSKRKICNKLIKKYNIGYIGNEYNKDFSLKNRIIIPSYNEYCDLNYWVGRDYTNTSKLRYKNPNVEKKNFIFNEKYINWYEDVTLVEGVFDHIVVPNSIPLLGKNIDETFVLYNTLLNKCKCNLNIFLDDDAFINAKKIYNLFYKTNLKDKLRIIECPSNYDASQIYEEFGHKGIIDVLNTGYRINEYDLIV